MPALQTINLGTADNDGTGSTLKQAGAILNAAVTELASRSALKALQADLAARRAGALAGKNNPRGNPTYDAATSPTLTATATLPASNPTANGLPTTVTTPAPFLPYITSTPGWRVNPGNNMVSVRDTTTTQPNTNYTVSGNATTNPTRFTFLTDDPKPVVEIQGGTQALRVIVDDQYLDMNGIVPGTGNIYLQIDFTKGATLTPALTVRKISIETQLAVGRVVRSSKAYTVYADQAPGPRGVAVADSWSTSGGGQTLGLNTWTRIMGDWLGVPLFGANGQGGTGIATPVVSGNPSTTAAYRARIPDLAQMGGIDFLVIGNVTNDWSAITGGTVTNANYITFVTNYLTDLRAALPGVPIVLLSGGSQDETTTSVTTAEDNIATIIGNMNTAGDNRIRHVRPTKPPNGGRSWLYGTGNSTTPTGDGNRDLYIGTVAAAHPNDAGHAYYGRRAAAEIYTALMSMT